MADADAPNVWGLKARLPDDPEIWEGASWIPSLKWFSGKVFIKTIYQNASKLPQEGRFWENEECQQFREVLKVTSLNHIDAKSRGGPWVLDNFWPWGTYLVLFENKMLGGKLEHNCKVVKNRGVP